MIHASTELLQAMMGVGPSLVEPVGSGCLCAAPTGRANRVFAFLYDGVGDEHTKEDSDPIDCSDCQRALRAAIGPERLKQLYVRWDQLQDTGAEVPLPWWYERKEAA